MTESRCTGINRWSGFFSRQGIKYCRAVERQDEYNHYINSEVSVFRCIFHDRWNQGHIPCDLKLKSKSKAMGINKDTSAKEITNFIGEPSEIEIKEDISIYYYEFERHYYEFDFSNDGKIVRIHAYLK